MKRIYIEITSDGLTLGRFSRRTIENQEFFRWEYGEVCDGVLHNASRLYLFVMDYAREYRLMNSRVIVSSLLMGKTSPVYLLPIILSITKAGLLIDGIYGESLLSEKRFMKFKEKKGEGLDFF